jgi:hypothetical protein
VGFKASLPSTWLRSNRSQVHHVKQALVLQDLSTWLQDVCVPNPFWHDSPQFGRSSSFSNGLFQMRSSEDGQYLDL